MLFLKKMSRVLGIFAFCLTVLSSINLSILRSFCLKPCPHRNCIILKSYIHITNISETLYIRLGILPDMKSTYGNRGKEK